MLHTSHGRRSRVPYAAIGVMCALASIQVSSCATSTRLLTVRTHELARFDPGDSLVLQLRDGTSVAGLYLRPTRFGDSHYRARYEVWRDSSAAAADLPRVGQAIQIHVGNKAPSSGRGEFSAFTHEGVEVGPERKLWRYPEISALEVIDGREVAGEYLFHLRLAGQLPVVTALHVETDAGDETVPLDDIVLVSGPVRTHSPSKSLLVVAGLTLIVVAVASNPSAPDVGCSPW